MVALVLEEIIQHIMVTTAFYFNWNAIASTVAVSPSLLMILGADVAVCFILSLWGLITQQKWATTLLIAPALFDRVEEFVAQGRLSIVVTVSFIVATSLLALTLSYRRQELRRAM